MPWLKYSDYMPKDGQLCWVVVHRVGYDGTPYRMVDRCVFNLHHQVWDDDTGDDFKYQLSQVSHWMPNEEPELPNE